MASPEVAKKVRARDTNQINGGGCQFPFYSEKRAGLGVCGYNLKVITHSIISPTKIIVDHFDSDYVAAIDQAKLLKIIKELRTNPHGASHYQEIFFNVLVLQNYLTNLKNYVLLCPLHHQLIYSQLRKRATVGNRVNWDLLSQLSLQFALEGVRYWNWQYDDWFFYRAEENTNRSRQENLSQSQTAPR